MEILHKDSSFKNQSEVRIIVNNQSPHFNKYMENNNYKIHVGSLRDITDIYDYYYEDMSIERFGNKRILFSLPEPKEYNIYDFGFFELIDLIFNVLNGNVTLKDEPSDFQNYQEKLKPILEHIHSKYGVVIVFNQDKSLSMINMSDELSDQLREKYSREFKCLDFENKINKLIDNGHIDEALSLCKSATDNQNLIGVADFCRGEIFRKIKSYEDSVSSYKSALYNDYKRVEALSSIASVYFDTKDYSKAIETYILIQEEIGFDFRIWGNIGICFIHLEEYGRAIESFEKGLEMNPNDAFLLYNEGVAYYRIGDMNRSKLCYEKALSIEPDNIEYQNALLQFPS